MLGLSEAALERRKKHIVAGDAARIMAGEWQQVWREKMGFDDPNDLSNVLAVQLGSFDEPFNLYWCQKQTGRRVDYYTDSPLLATVWERLTGESTPDTGQVAHPEWMVSRLFPWMGAHLDGMTTTARGERCVIDAKHVGRSDDPMIVRYTAAGTHQATVAGCNWWALSVLIGNSKWELIEQEVDPLYQAELIEAETEFLGYVERGEEPEDRVDAAVLPPAPQPRLRIVQLEDEFRDAWPNWAGDMLPLIRTFAETNGAATVHNITRDKIKKLLPDDVGEITRGLFKLHRDKAGAVRMSLKKEKADDRS
jgi:hypothetical protein